MVARFFQNAENSLLCKSHINCSLFGSVGICCSLVGFAMQWGKSSKLEICVPELSAKAHVLAEGRLGHRVYHEWRYLHRIELHKRDKMHVYLRAPHVKELLDVLEIPAGELLVASNKPDHRSAVELREHLVSSAVMVALVIKSIQVRSSSRDTKVAAWALVRSLLGRAQDALARSEGVPIGIELLNGTRVQLHLTPSGFIDLEPLSASLVTFAAAWEACTQSELAPVSSPMIRATLVDLVAFSSQVHGGASFLKSYRQTKTYIGATLLKVLVELIAWGWEKFVIEDYRPSTSRPLSVVHGNVRKLRVDPDLDLKLLDRVDAVHGDAATVAQVLMGDRSRMRRLRHAYNVLYLRKARKVFEAVTHLHVSCDPSSYSGEHTQVAVCFSWQSQVSAVMPIKVVGARRKVF